MAGSPSARRASDCPASVGGSRAAPGYRHAPAHYAAPSMMLGRRARNSRGVTELGLAGGGRLPRAALLWAILLTKARPPDFFRALYFTPRSTARSFAFWPARRRVLRNGILWRSAKPP